jgi:hypothetical protein
MVTNIDVGYGVLPWLLSCCRLATAVGNAVCCVIRALAGDDTAQENGEAAHDNETPLVGIMMHRDVAIVASILGKASISY